MRETLGLAGCILIFFGLLRWIIGDAIIAGLDGGLGLALVCVSWLFRRSAR